MKEAKEAHNYDDIINLSAHHSTKHIPMSVSDRAAQFAPFAALTGHTAAIKETERQTDRKIELDEEIKNKISDKLNWIAENINKLPEVSITFFQPDKTKSGGRYLTTTGAVKKINAYEHYVEMMDKTIIPIGEILAIDGDLFKCIEDF